MNNERTLEVIASTPRCHVTQIVDKLGMEFEDLHASLAAMEAVGDIVVEESAGTDARLGKAYSLSDKFKASEAYKRIALKADAAGFAAPGVNRIERAIAFVRERGTATSSELHALMGLQSDEYASNALASAVRTKRLVKDGKNWTIGPGPGGGAALVTAEDDWEPAEPSKPVRTASAARVASFPTPAFLPKAADAGSADTAISESQGDANSIAAGVMASVVASAMSATAPVPARPVKPKAEPEVAEAPAPTEPASCSAPAIRCGLWSDGHVEIQRDGQTKALLAVEEMVYLADFWSRIANSIKEAS